MIRCLLTRNANGQNNPSPEIQNCLEKINKSSEDLLSLINDVLDLSSIESGKTTYKPIPVCIKNLTDITLDSHPFLH
ncbi:hypothetical protein C6W64_008980 [Blautia sp. SG-772]|nr:hypothetical protein C6W64_008980 [Blautia sp. SG-772]